MNIKKHLINIAKENDINDVDLQFPDCEIDVEKIKVIMISEVPPGNTDDYFYSKAMNSNYMESTINLFSNAGVLVS